MSRAIDRSLFLLRLIFVVSAALIFFLMGLTYKHLESVGQTHIKVNESIDFSMKLEELSSTFFAMERDQKNFILTSDPFYRDRVKNEIEKIEQITAEIRENSSIEKEQISNIDKLDQLVSEKLLSVTHSLEIQEKDYQVFKDQLLGRIKQGNDQMEQISVLISQMLSTEKQLLSQRRNDLLFFQRSTPIYLYLISLFSLGLLAFSFYKISKDVKEQKRINHDLELSLDTLGLTEVVGEYGTWTQDLATKKVRFSKHHYELLGVDPLEETLSLERYFEFVHPEDLSRVKKQFEKLERGEEMPVFRYRVVRADGQQRQFQSVGRRVTTMGKSLINLVMTSDVSREIEDQLKLEGINYVLSERNKNLSVANEIYLQAEKIGFFGTWQYYYQDNEFVFSDNFVRLLGLEPGGFSNHIKYFLPYVYLEDREMITQFIKDIYEGKDREPFVSRILPKGQNSFSYISTTGKKISNPYSGEYYLVISLDITEEYEIRQDLQQKNLALVANNKELQAFNYAASHDLQEPLRKIETFLSRLWEKDLERMSDPGKQYMERTRVAAGRMRQLIDDLLRFSRSTRSEESFEWIDLNLLMHNAIEELAHLIDEKNVTIRTNTLPTLMVIPFQIQQMFVNLIGNSIKYAKEGVAPEIEIDCQLTTSDKEPVLRGEVKTRYYKFTFKDNGIGFENQYSERIFTLFNRLHSRGDYQGTGIGLAICKKIVENHNGYIYAQSTPGEGSVFTVLLPDASKT